MKETIQLITTDGSVLFEHTQKDNSITKTLNEFINVQNYKNLSNINLSNQNLEGLSFENMSLIGANFKSANLKNVTFDFANLSNADLSRADLSRADLSGADLRWADLSRADLSGADLSEANLRRADLKWTKLIGANLSGADLRGADLYDAYLEQTKLDGVLINYGTQFFALQCPSKGSFIGWKKAGTTIIKLLIPEDAQRSSATTLKCRCSKAKVLDIQNLDGSKHSFSQVQSDYDSNFIYEVGKTVEVSNFDEDRWKECSSGIHFFMSREIAVNY